MADGCACLSQELRFCFGPWKISKDLELLPSCCVDLFQAIELGGELLYAHVALGDVGRRLIEVGAQRKDYSCSLLVRTSGVLVHEFLELRHRSWPIGSRARHQRQAEVKQSVVA